MGSIIPISYKTQSISLGPILENVPGLEVNNSGIILKEQNNNLSIGLDKKLGKLGEGLLDNKDDALKQQQEDEEDNVGDEKKEANVNTENKDENVQNGNNNLEKQEMLKKQQEDKPKVDSNGEDEDESSPFGLNFNFNSNLDTNVEVDKIKIAELNKKLQDLKDRLLNDQDNQRLVEQREADEASKDEVIDKEQVKAGSRYL